MSDENSFVEEPALCPSTTKELAKVVINFGEMLCRTRMGKKIRLYNYQRVFAMTVVEAVLMRTGAEPTALYSRQSGKSEALAVISLACAVFLPVLAAQYPDDPRLVAFLKGFRIGIYAFKQDKAQIIYDRIREYASTTHAQAVYANEDFNIAMTASRGSSCAWSNGSYVLAQTASDTTDNEGETWDLLIIDEAQKISTNKVDKELRPMLTTSNGPLVMIGTASFSKGVFYHRIMSNLAHERATGQRLHFQYDYVAVVAERRAVYEAEVARYKKFVGASPRVQAKMLEVDPASRTPPSDYHLNYERHIERQLAGNGNNKDEETFKMNYRLLWSESRAIAFDSEHFATLRMVTLDRNVRPPQGAVLAAGLDIAKGEGDGSDNSVLTIGLVDVDHPILDVEQSRIKPDAEPIYHHNKLILDWGMFSGSFEHRQYGGVVSLLEQFPGVLVLYVDATGMGDPVAERLALLLPHIVVVPYAFTLPNKSNGYKKYTEEVKASRIRYPAGPNTKDSVEYKRFIAEHTDLQRTYRNGMMVCLHQEGGHDDFPDSAMLFNLAADAAVKLRQTAPGATVEVTEFAATGGVRHVATAPVGLFAPRAPMSRADRYKAGRVGGGRGR